MSDNIDRLDPFFSDLQGQIKAGTNNSHANARNDRRLSDDETMEEGGPFFFLSFFFFPFPSNYCPVVARVIPNDLNAIYISESTPVYQINKPDNDDRLKYHISTKNLILDLPTLIESVLLTLDDGMPLYSVLP